MLNIGLIGNTEYLEPFVKRIPKNPRVNIVGKTSVGTSSQLNSFHFSIPEFNRIELIERSDIILLDNSTIIPFNVLCSIVKKSKHIFAADYLTLTIDECSQLVKLANESGSVIQFSNPNFYRSAIQWLNKNLLTPTFFDVSFFSTEINNTSLYQLLFMLLDITGISPKKVEAVSFQSKQTNSKFNNVRLEFNDASVVNLNYGNLQSLNEFKIKAYSPEQFVTMNLTSKAYLCNNQPIEISGFSPMSEFDVFFDSVARKSKIISSIEDYFIALSVIQKINKKISQFSVL